MNVNHPAPTLTRLNRKWLSELETTHLSPFTLRNRSVRMNKFLAWCAELGIENASEVNLRLLQSYQCHLFNYRIPKTGKPLGIEYQSTCLRVIKQFFDWLFEQQYITDDPAAKLKLPKPGRRLPTNHFTSPEVEAVIAGADTQTPNGIRDRAIMEVFYSTGIRRLELIKLSLYDLNPESRLLTIRQGKNRQDRVVPIGQRALVWLSKYLLDVRPDLAHSDLTTGSQSYSSQPRGSIANSNRDTIFLTDNGEPFHPVTMSQLIRRYIGLAGLHHRGSCHIFRHTTATLMMENGADLRSLQTLLGHAKLNTTQLYTHVTIKRLREVHDATHPADNQTPASKQIEAERREPSGDLSQD